LRELDFMVQGKGNFEWAQTAGLMALQINMNSKKKVNPDELNPFAEKQKVKKVKLSTKDSMAALKSVFIDRKAWEKK
jgi:hypothetical protein